MLDDRFEVLSVVNEEPSGLESIVLSIGDYGFGEFPQVLFEDTGCCVGVVFVFSEDGTRLGGVEGLADLVDCVAGSAFPRKDTINRAIQAQHISIIIQDLLRPTTCKNQRMITHLH